ncbi:hypothetical protein Tco_0304990 [Tanacetum coccineum]
MAYYDAVTSKDTEEPKLESRYQDRKSQCHLRHWKHMKTLFVFAILYGCGNIIHWNLDVNNTQSNQESCVTHQNDFVLSYDVDKGDGTAPLPQMTQMDEFCFLDDQLTSLSPRN